MSPLTHALVLFGGTAAGLGLVAWVRRPQALTVEITPPPAPLEPWEEEAEFGGNVGGDEEDLIWEAQPAPAVGEGHPAELCGPAENPRPPEVCVLDPLGHPRFAPKPGRAPLGEPGLGATWPLDTRHRRRLVTSYWTNEGLRGAWGRHFGAKRVSSEGQIRRHAGIDVFGRPGDLVVAPERGRIVAIMPFHHGTWAIYLRLSDNRVVNLGEIQKYSWREFGIRPGDQVYQGQPLARIGTMSGGDHMLHMQLYDTRRLTDPEVKDAARRGEMRWQEEAPPQLVQDPSAYLVDAAARSYRLEQARA